jgi:hypothetical protein
VLIVAEPSTHPTLKQLSAEALSAWHLAVARCDLFRTDLVEVRELQGVSEDTIDEWARVALASRLPWGHVRLLGRGRIWDYNRDLGRAA